MEITGDELLDMMFLPLTDDRVINMLDALGMEQPVIDEQYEMDREVAAGDDEGIGLTFVFREDEHCLSRGDPCLIEIDFSHEKVASLPYGLSFNDSYQKFCEVLGKKAEYQFKPIPELKIWVRRIKNDIEILLNVQFKEDLSSVKAVVVTDFEEGDEMIEPNKQ